MNDICAVIPAAGRGSRLGLDVPKILAPISFDKKIIDVLISKLLPNVDAINIIVSKFGYDQILDHLKKNNYPLSRIFLSIQNDPVGMGDAIFCGYEFWGSFESIMIIWGDQVFVSNNTIVAAKNMLNNFDLVLPLVNVDRPYVQYILENNKISDILQTREGDSTSSCGFSDIGFFLIRNNGLKNLWRSYLDSANLGALTNEINFLPFVKMLSQYIDFRFGYFIVDNVVESHGINTIDDLIFAQKKFLLGDKS